MFDCKRCRLLVSNYSEICWEHFQVAWTVAHLFAFR